VKRCRQKGNNSEELASVVKDAEVLRGQCSQEGKFVTNTIIVTKKKKKNSVALVR
jgi:hypothetical protein